MNDDFPEVANNDHLIRELIAHIRCCEANIESASIAKQSSESRLKDLLGHDKEGASTYNFEPFKVVITTGLNYKFDKKKYVEFMKSSEKIDPRFSLVKEVTQLELNKKAIRDLDEFGSQQDKYLKSLFITTSDKKLHISIKENKQHESINHDLGSVDADGVFKPTAN